MKAFIFDPLWDGLITEELTKQLKDAGIVPVITTVIAPLHDSKELYEGSEDRILCLNPDYVNWKLTAEDYKDIPNLKGIFGQATSNAWVDASYADANNIPICNIKNFSTEAVAEWAIMMLHNVARQVPNLIKDGFPLDFDKDYMKYRGIELHGKTAGIVGLGNIGSAIAKRCEGLGMDVIYWARSPKESTFKQVELDELLKTADVIFPAMTNSEEARAILTNDLLGKMKPEAILVAIEHHLFDVDHVLAMVKTGKLYGFGFEAEPQSFNNYTGNVWAAPAYGWATDTTMHNAMIKWVDNMVKASEGKFPNRIN